jgi:hypothetical protein
MNAGKLFDNTKNVRNVLEMYLQAVYELFLQEQVLMCINI